MSKLEEGLYHKYNVTRTDGEEVGDAIVLEFKDPLARIAIRMWASHVDSQGYHELFHDVHNKLDKHIESTAERPLEEGELVCFRSLPQDIRQPHEVEGLIKNIHQILEVTSVERQGDDVYVTTTGYHKPAIQEYYMRV